MANCNCLGQRQALLPDTRQRQACGVERAVCWQIDGMPVQVYEREGPTGRLLAWSPTADLPRYCVRALRGHRARIAQMRKLPLVQKCVRTGSSLLAFCLCGVRGVSPYSHPGLGWPGGLAVSLAISDRLVA